MSKTMKSLIVFLSVLVVGILLSVGTYMIFNPIKEERAKIETLSVLEGYFKSATDFESNALETTDGVEILKSLRVYEDEKPLGYFYEANIKNDFGNMKIRLSLDTKDVIQTIEFLEMNQTMYQAQTEAMLETYKLSKLSGDIFDGAAGATSISKKDLSHLIRILGHHHDQTDKFEIILPYQPFYGDDYVIETTENTTVEGATIVIETIEGQGVVYTITKAGIYQTGSIEEKSITLVVALDNDGKIIGILLPVELYNHTKGNFMTNALEFAESFVGMNIADIVDGQAGATGEVAAHNSRTLLEEMFLIIQEVHGT